MTEVDAVVVGAGPAGGMAARAMARAGFHAVILERRRQVGVPVQCGEGVSAAALELNGLREEEEWINKRVKGAKLWFPGDTWCYITREPGYSLYRGRFDQWIVDGAVGLGAELKLRTAFRGMNRSNGVWKVRTNRGTLHVPIVIGADGPVSTVAQSTGWLRERSWLNTLEYRFREEDMDYPDSEHFNIYASARYRGGYAWVFPRDGEYNVGVVSPTPVRASVQGFCEHLGLDARKTTEVIGGLIPHRLRVDHYAKDGVALAGDVAGIVNPLSGGGIHAALYTGRIAGEWAVRALDGGDPGLIEGYEKELLSSPFADPILWKTASDYREWREEALAYVGSRLNGRNLPDITWKDAGGAFLRRPRYLRYMKKLSRVERAMRLSATYGW